MRILMGWLRRKGMGWVLGVILAMLTAGQGRAEAQRLRRMEFGSSSQRMGVRFTEELRDWWRRRWIRRA